MTQKFAQEALAILVGLVTGTICGVIISAIIGPLKKAGIIASCQTKRGNGPAPQLRERPWPSPPPPPAKPVEPGMWARRCGCRHKKNI